MTIKFNNAKKTKTAHFKGDIKMNFFLGCLIFIAIALLFIGILDIIEEKLIDANLPSWLKLIVVIGYLYLITKLNDWIEPGVNKFVNIFTAETNCPATRSVKQIAKKRHSHPPSINSTKSLRLAGSLAKNHN